MLCTTRRKTLSVTNRLEIFVDTDVLAAYLAEDTSQPSALQALMRAAVCFTSVLNAGELIAVTRNDEERAHAESVLWGLKVLGFHHKYSLTFGDLHRESGGMHFRDSMVAGMCILSKLPLCTSHPERYRAYPGLSLIDAGDVTGTNHEILTARIAEVGAKAGGTKSG